MPNPKSTPSVEAFMQDLQLLDGDERYAVVTAVRDHLLAQFKPCTEVLKYGGILFTSGTQFCGIFVYKAHVTVEFGHGAAIQDPWGHLEGSGKLRRHIKLETVADIQTKRLHDYLVLALAAAQAV